MNLWLEGKTVLITGSSGGIGKATARSFLEEGACVLLNGRNKEKLVQLQLEYEEAFGRGKIFHFAGDMSDINTIQECKKYIQSQWGRLDILVPNLGNGKGICADKLAIEEWQHMMEKNLYPTVNLIRILQPLLENSRKANIVLLSSVVAYERANAPYAYSAAKGAILSLNRCLAGEFAYKQLRVNCVVPGNVFFEGGRWEELQNADKNGVEQYLKENVPMGRFAKPEEIADAIVFLASERSSFTTGAALVIDGGQKRS